MLFYSYFKTLVGKEVTLHERLPPSPPKPRRSSCCMFVPCQVTVELKNDLCITGNLHSVDQYLNIKLTNTRVVNEQKYPHMVCASIALAAPQQ